MADYEAAKESMAYRVLEGAGYVHLGGETRFDFIQRQSSNDVGLLSAARAVPNVLTSPSGRILELFSLVEDDEGFGLLTPAGRGATLADYFARRIFFNDRVELQDVSAEWIQIEVQGPRAEEILSEVVGIESAPGLDEVASGSIGKGPVRVVGQRGAASKISYLLVAPKSLREGLVKELGARGGSALRASSADLLRIEAGLPDANEFTADYTPFEVGLAYRVSGSKGCYTGQEVLARQVTYDKITRRLVQLQAAEPVQVGATVRAQEKQVGQVSSVALSPSLGALALAVVRRPYHEAGAELEIVGESGEVKASVRKTISD